MEKRLSVRGMMSAMACWLPSLCHIPFFKAGFEMAAYGREVEVDEEAAWPLREDPSVDQGKTSCGGAEMDVWLLREDPAADQDVSASGRAGDVVGGEAGFKVTSRRFWPSPATSTPGGSSWT